MLQQIDAPAVTVPTETADDGTHARRLPLWAIPPVQWAAIALPLMIIGWLITGPFDLTATEERANVWLANHRTDLLDDLTVIPTKLASTEGIVVVAGIAAFWFVATRRWPSLALLTWALTAELTIFLVTNLVVGRPRPEVVKLDSVPATSSFPSGHVAATVALYGSLALIAALTHRGAVRVALQWTFVVVATACVAYARVYRGAHHIADVVAGAALGIACVIAAAYLAFRVTEWLRSRGHELEGSDFS